MRTTTYKGEWVESFPEALEPGTLYVSTRFRTAAHLCACGCGSKVVTPLRPTDWRVIWNGDEFSLEPSIGNWSFPCRSHYWILRGRVRWAKSWSAGEIEAGRMNDDRAKRRFFRR